MKARSESLSEARAKIPALAPVQKRENRTGLPDRLKEGVESLSGLAMDDVRVHYASAKPMQLQACAYAQGNEIHVGPGQEQHLPHEAWHVVQQKQGRVRPTGMLGQIPVNDSSGLEREADRMGAGAAAHRSGAAPAVRGLSGGSVGAMPPVQRTLIVATVGDVPLEVDFLSGDGPAGDTNQAFLLAKKYKTRPVPLDAANLGALGGDTLHIVGHGSSSSMALSAPALAGKLIRQGLKGGKIILVSCNVGQEFAGALRAELAQRGCNTEVTGALGFVSVDAGGEIHTSSQAAASAVVDARLAVRPPDELDPLDTERYAEELERVERNVLLGGSIGSGHKGVASILGPAFVPLAQNSATSTSASREVPSLL